jgi:hypothetical protein
MATYAPCRLYFSYTGTIAGEEKPWIVVSTGVTTRAL